MVRAAFGRVRASSGDVRALFGHVRAQAAFGLVRAVFGHVRRCPRFLALFKSNPTSVDLVVFESLDLQLDFWPGWRCAM